MAARGAMRCSIAALLLLSASAGVQGAGERVVAVVKKPSLDALAPPPPGEGTGPGSKKRVLLIVSPECERCEEELRKLNAVGGTWEILRKRGWKIGPEAENHIQIVDRTQPVADDIAGIVEELKPGPAPLVVCIEEGAIERSFQKGCTTPLDPWTFGWLMTGNDLRPAEYVDEPVTVKTTGNYRLRGNHWSVEGNWNPTQNEVSRHLRALHSNQLQAGWKIEDWSVEELRSLHDDIHDREEGFRGRYASTSTTSARSGGGSGAGKPGSWKR